MTSLSATAGPARARSRSGSSSRARAVRIPLRPLGDALGIPLLVAILAQATILFAASLAKVNPLDAATWARWDGQLYLDIAQRGLQMAPCTSVGIDLPGYQCGNAGWFPGWSWQVGALWKLGLPLYGSGVLVSHAYATATLLVVWNGLLDREKTIPAISALVFVGFVPGAVYASAAFPLSMGGFWLVAALAAQRRERHVLVAVCLAAAVTAYPIAVIGAFAIALQPLLRKRVRQSAIAVAGCALGLGAMLLVTFLQTGAFDAYRKVQAPYGHGMSAIVPSIIDTFRVLWSPPPFGRITAIQAIVVMAVVLLVVWRAWRLRGQDVLAPAALATVSMWMFPFVFKAANGAGLVSLYRSDALLVCAAPVIARMRGRTAGLIALAAVALCVPLARTYASGVLT